jgi:hypothetical protein
MHLSSKAQSLCHEVRSLTPIPQTGVTLAQTDEPY